MSDHEQQVLTFVEITQADPDLAAVFLKHNDWEMEPAVEEYMSNPGRYMVETDAAEADETVRQPLAPIMSRLADDEYEPSTRHRRGKRKRVEAQQETPRIAEGIFDALRDLQSEELYFKHLNTVEKPAQIKHQRRLADLYRPPHAIIARGNFDEVNEIARTTNKWLLVNVHHGNEFDCLRINRDVWSKAPIQQLVRDYFVLWYIYTTTATAKPYTSYYPTTDWPHVAVLDPCTGERLAVWEGRKYSEGSALDEALNAFVAQHIAELSTRTVSTERQRPVVRSEGAESGADQGGERAVKRRRLADDEEERMMHLAIMASLMSEEVNQGSVEDKGSVELTEDEGRGEDKGHREDREERKEGTGDVRRSGGGDRSSNNNNTSSNNNNTSSNNNTSNNNTITTPINNNTINNTPNDEVTPQHRPLSRNNSNVTIHGNASTTNSSTPDPKPALSPTSTPIPLTTTAPSNAPVLQIQLRLPSSRTEPLSYSADTPLHVLLRDVAGLLHLPSTSAVSVSSNYPRRTYTHSQGQQSLHALGIENKSVLFVDVSE